MTKSVLEVENNERFPDFIELELEFTNMKEILSLSPRMIGIFVNLIIFPSMLDIMKQNDNLFHTHTHTQRC